MKVEFTKLELALIISLMGEQSSIASIDKLLEKKEKYKRETVDTENRKFVINAVENSDIDSYDSGDLWDKLESLSREFNRKSSITNDTYEYLIVFRNIDDEYRISKEYYTDIEEFGNLNLFSTAVSVVTESKRLRSALLPNISITVEV